jgi:hypothetical protein
MPQFLPILLRQQCWSTRGSSSETCMKTKCGDATTACVGEEFKII